MSPLVGVLAAVLASGGAGGLVALLRLRTDKGSTVVDTVSRGLVVLERVNGLLEDDLSAERTMRHTAEAELGLLREQLRNHHRRGEVCPKCASTIQQGSTP